MDGWSLTMPDGWKHAEQQGVHALGSDTEAGLILITYTPGLTFEAMLASASSGLNEQGLLLLPMNVPVQGKIGNQNSVTVDLQGKAMDGTTVQSHAVGVAGPSGGLVILGLTTPAQIKNLSDRVDQIARTVSFSAPQLGSVALLQGTVCAWNGSSSYSATSRMSFDGQGHVSYGSEFSAGGSFKDSTGNVTSDWSVMTGNQNQNSSYGSYAIDQNTVRIRWPNGSEQSCTVHHRAGNGQITELYCGSQLYGAALCD